MKAMRVRAPWRKELDGIRKAILQDSKPAAVVLAPGTGSVQFVARSTLRIRVVSRWQWSWGWPWATLEHVVTIDPPPPKGQTVIVETSRG